MTSPGQACWWRAGASFCFANQNKRRCWLFASTAFLLECATWAMCRVFVHGERHVWSDCPLGSLQCSIAEPCWNPGLFLPSLTLHGPAACAGTEEFHAVMGSFLDHFPTCVTDTLPCCCFSGMNYLHFPVAASLYPHSSLPCEPMDGLWLLHAAFKIWWECLAGVVLKAGHCACQLRIL